MDFAKYMTTVWPTPAFYENPCEVKYGTCNIKKSCTELKQTFKDEGKEFSLTFNLKGTDDKEISITLPWEEMLIEPKDSEKTEEEQEKGTEICYFPIYALRNEQSNNWILGKVVMEDYYTVFDLTNNNQEGDFVEITMGAKNTKYKKNPDVPGGGDDNDKPSNKPKGVEIAVIILALVIVIATLGLLYVCIKRKQRNDATFQFDHNKDYGAIKMGNKQGQTSGK